MKGKTPGLQEFVEHFIQQFEEPINGEVLPETLLKNVPGWSSLQALIVVASFDWEYGVTITSEELERSDTLKSLHSLVVSKMAKRLNHSE